MFHVKHSFLAMVLALVWSAPACAADHLSIILDWFVNANHEALFAAKYSGAYARQNLDVQFIVPTDPSSPPRLLAAHQADLCVSYQPELPLLDAAGLKLVRAGTLEDTPLNTLIVLGDGPVKSLADLKGKRIGASVGATDETLLKAMLATAGLKLTDVTVTEVNFQLEQALMSHRVDAIIGGMRNYEMIDLQQRGLKPVGFFPEEHGVPLYDELILLARQDDMHDPRIKRFLAALQEGTNTLLNHPDEMWQAFIKERPELDTTLNHAAWFAGLPRLAKNPALLDQSRYEAFEQFMVTQGSLAHTEPVGSFAIQP